MVKLFGRRALARAALTLFVLTSVVGCSDPLPLFHAEGSPQRLSDWQLFTLSDTEFSPVPASMVFEPANQLFTDYAQKLRTLWLPAETTAQLIEGEIVYPVGTVLSKTFYYPVSAAGNALQQEPHTQTRINLQTNQLLETRLLVRRETGWAAFPYVWNEAQTEAFLRVAGSTKAIRLQTAAETMDFSYFVPNENQCAGCHVTDHPDGDMQPLAASLQQLSVASTVAGSESGELQTQQLVRRGWLQGSVPTDPVTSWLDAAASIDDRAIAYLGVHCGHCHNPEGAADTSALLLDGTSRAGVNLGVCKPPVAAGGGAGNRLFSIVPGAPERSILLYRMESSAPDEMMPELGRSLIHTEGVALIRQWIADMPGSCTASVALAPTPTNQ